MKLPQPGTRIECLEIGPENDGRPDPDPVAPGTQGTVDGVSGPHKTHPDEKPWYQIHVRWDNGRTLSLSVPKDRFRVLGNPGDFVTTCHKGHQLYIKTLTLRPHHKGVPVHADGFTYDNDADTEDEVVTCYEPGCPDADLATVE